RSRRLPAACRPRRTCFCSALCRWQHQCWRRGQLLQLCASLWDNRTFPRSVSKRSPLQPNRLASVPAKANRSTAMSSSARADTGVHLFRFAAPAEFYWLAGKLLPWFAVIALVLAVAGLYIGFFVAPTDATQGDSYRIIFIHVPSAWMAMFLYCVMA